MRWNLIFALLICLGLNLSVFAQQGKTLTNDDIAPPVVNPVKAETQDKLKDLVITLERTGCFGLCPIYKITVYGDGRVVYKGDKYVRTLGEQVGRIDKEKVEKLLKEFEKISYFSLNDDYSGGPTDASTAITSIKMSGKKKTIKHYHASPDAPKDLTELENIIDNVVNSSQWID